MGISRAKVGWSAVSCLAGLAVSLVALAECPAPGQWYLPQGENIAFSELMAQLEDSDVVLLGERHDRMEHHRWQLHTLAGLHARRADMVIGLEMLPRQAQPALDAWVAGELDKASFLEKSQWDEAWGYDPALYLPILHFARLHRIPLVAININRELRVRLAAEGWDSVSEAERFAITPPAKPPEAYRDSLTSLLAMHPLGEHEGYDEERFIAGQLVWDRAMASGLAEAAAQGALVVGLIGEGHLEFGHGVPHQLADLGIENSQVLLPWESEASNCRSPPAGLAHALFAISADDLHEPDTPMRLGILLDPDEQGVRVRSIGEQSLASQAGLAIDDVVTHAAGRRLQRPAELVAQIRRQPPGTLLPLEILRDEKSMEILVRFPAETDE